MALSRLGMFRVRNLVDQTIAPVRGVNLITGPNAAGKTSVLEAVHLLARAGSFRTSRVEQVIQHQADDLVVSASVTTADRAQHQLGLQRGHGGTRVRIDNDDVRNLSELARYLPLQLINTESQRLLNDGPKVRRSFLNWSVFHVEHDYYQNWRRYDRALRQRNAALRQGDVRLGGSWEPELVSAAARVDGARRRVVDMLVEELAPLAAAWLPGIEISVRYRRGWSSQDELAELLATGRPRERELGYTVHGPHRADLSIRAQGMDAQHWLSRGQQKTLAIALLLAQGRVISRAGALPLLLIDDLRAELDAEHAKRILEVVAAGPAQSFITAIDRDTVPLDVDRWFHIQQGRLQEMV